MGGGNSLYTNAIGDVHFISYDTPHNASWVEPGDYCHTFYLPNSSNMGFCQENAEAMVAYIKEHNIQLLFVVVESLVDYIRYIRQHTTCRVVYWLHGQPDVLDVSDRIGVQRTYLEHRETGWKKFSLLLKYYLFIRPFRIPKLEAFYKQRTFNRYNDVLTSGDGMFVLCQAYKEEVAQMGIAPALMERVYPMLNTISVLPNPKLEKKKEIVFVGRLSEEKRVDHLLRIWQRIYKQLPDWSLHIYGTGPEEEYLRDVASSLGLSRAYFEGYTSNTQAVYDRASIACLTSYIEGWPLALVEAQNNGVIPLAYRVSAGVSSILGEQGAYGYAIPDGDEEAYAQQLLELCNNDSLRAEKQQSVLRKREAYKAGANDETWRKFFGDVLGIQLD